MKKFGYISSLLLGVLLIVGCTNSVPMRPDPLPDDEIAAYKRAIIKLAPYIMIEDSAYHCIITIDEAVRMGVPGKYFNRLIQDLEYTNYIIKEEYNKKGIPIEMSEYQIGASNE